MTHGPMRALATLAILATSLCASSAFADVTKDQCIDANTQAQSLRRDGKLGAAREQLRVCIDPGCPAIVRNDCTQRLDELDRVQPGVVFDVKDGAGHDLVAVKVSMDGKVLAEKLGGTALLADPGAHTFTFETAGGAPVTQTLVLREGEKARVEHIVITLAPAPRTPLAALPVAAPPAQAQGGAASSPRRTIGIAGVAVGAAGLLVGAIAGGVAISKNSTLKRECPGGICMSATTPRSDFDSYNTVTTVSTVGFVVGGVLAAAGVVLIVTAPKAPAASGSVSPVVGPGFLGLRGKF